MLCNEPLS